MHETLTPRENLTFAAGFTLGTPKSDRSKAVQDILSKLKLERCADTVVGTPGLVKGISGGERKRTNVAMSLLGRPSLLLMDEPTSGLDSKMAAELMTDVGEVAKQGCTVIATIHQPSEDVFHKFTKVLLLESGATAYFGPIAGLRQRLVSLGFSPQEHTPLPEMLLDIIEVPEDMVETPAAHMNRLAQLHMQSTASPFTTSGVPVIERAPLQPCHQLAFHDQLRILFFRSFLVLRRNKILTLVRTGQTLLSASVIGWIFSGLDKSLSNVHSRMFCSLLFAMGQFMFALIGVINTFPAERAVFLREAQDRWYNPAAFYLAKVTLDTIMQCFFPLLVTAIGYQLAGLNISEPERPLLFYVISALLANAGSGMGFVVSAAVSNVSTALSMAPAMILPQLMLSGIFIKIHHLPQPFQALSYATVIKYAVQALVNNEFDCEAQPACDTSWKSRGGESCAASPCDVCCTAQELATSGGVCPLLTCQDAIRFLGLDADSIWPAGTTMTSTIHWNILALLILVVVFRLIGLLVLIRVFKRASHSG